MKLYEWGLIIGIIILSNIFTFWWVTKHYESVPKYFDLTKVVDEETDKMLALVKSKGEVDPKALEELQRTITVDLYKKINSYDSPIFLKECVLSGGIDVTERIKGK